MDEMDGIKRDKWGRNQARNDEIKRVNKKWAIGETKVILGFFIVDGIQSRIEILSAIPIR